jgi:hypothetical protein
MRPKELSADTDLGKGTKKVPENTKTSIILKWKKLGN